MCCLVSSGGQGISGIDSIGCVGLFCGSLSCALVVFIGLFFVLVSRQRRPGQFVGFFNRVYRSLLWVSFIEGVKGLFIGVFNRGYRSV